MRTPSEPDAGTLTLLVSLGLCWSLVTPLARIAGEAGVPALFFPAAATLGGAVTLGALFLWQRRMPLTSPEHLRLYVVSGITGHALPQVTIFLSVQHVPIGIVGLAIAMTPLCTLAFSLLARLEGFSPGRFAGLALGFAGALLVLLPRSALPDPAIAPWVLFSFLTPLLFAASNVLAVALRPPTGDARGNALGMMVTSGVILWVAVAVFDHGYMPRSFGSGDMALLGNSLVAGLAFVLYFMLLDRAGAVVMSFVSFINLGLATLYGILFFGERPSLWLLAAIAAIVGGLELVRRSPARPAR